jgi:hypothetical protein
MSLSRSVTSLLVSLLAVGCGSSGGGGGGGTAEPERVLVGSCVYVNAFSKGEECKRYWGTDWTADSAATDCQTGIIGDPGTFSTEDACDYADYLGTCAIAADTPQESELVFPGTDAGQCAATQQGCEVFAQGVFTPGPICDGTVVGSGSGSGGGVFVQPYQVCKEPLAGEPAGQSANGEVCTWVLISGSTEEGRRYQDYGNCEDVLTQRPYYAAPPAGETASNDARLDDAAYMTEVAWAREQVAASACVCCHSEPLAPQGASQWYLEAPGIWLDSISDSGIAMMAGLADSTALGAFEPEENNGFDRSVVGTPTTDNARMQALFLGEWARRGYTPEDAASIPAFGGPLVTQLEYVPQACDDTQGLGADGTLRWIGGDARYLYVLEANAANPGVPPNLDEPDGTLWLVDVPTASAPFASGITYGQVSGDMRQRIPAGQAPALQSGTTYYLYVLADIGIPVTRCLFVAP